MAETISPDFSKRLILKEQNIIYKSDKFENDVLITVGVPTFKRNTLKRALISLSKQKFRNFRVIVSDNAGISQDTLNIIKSVSKELPSIYLIAQKENIGALGNLSFLLNCASSEFFMWLADDDEIEENYLATLYDLLSNNNSAIAAMGGWKKMSNKNKYTKIIQANNPTLNITKRVFKYIVYQQNDSAFYGLHRTEFIRKSRFEGYFPPNTRVISNCCYLILFDLILRGPIIYTNKTNWISHSYDEKSYLFSEGSNLIGKLKILLRRINVYILYISKTIRFRKSLIPIVLFGALISFTIDIAKALIKVSNKKIKINSKS